MSKLPPKWAMRFFRWFCRKDLADAVEGDLLELYQRKAAQYGRWRANLFFTWHALSFFQPFAFKRQHEQYAQLNPVHMFFNALKIGYRFLSKHKTYTTINVLGLAMGISAFVLMGLFVVDELSYDKFHSDGERIVRIGYHMETPSASRKVARLPFPMKAELLNKYPEVEQVARFYHSSFDLAVLAYGDRKYTEADIYFGEPDIFEVFDFDLKRGNPATALSDPRSIVLSQEMANKYFGDEDPIGKVMRYKNEDDLVVTGILEDIPENSHIRFDFLCPIDLQRQRWMGWGQFTYDLELDWNWAGAWVYATLSPGTPLEAFTEKIQAIADEHFNQDNKALFTLVVQPLWDIHLKSDMSNEASTGGNITQVYVFASVAVLILLIACINFINLSTAQATRRTREIGLRKVMGAQRKQLLLQFMAESVMVVLTAVLIAMVLVGLTLPVFNDFTNKSLDFTHLGDVTLIPILVLVILLIAVISGGYPAMQITHINPVQGLKSGFSSVGSRRRFNKGLVVGQLVVSNLLIIGVLVVKDQLSFIKNKDLGFDKEHVLVIEHGKNISKEQYELFHNGLSANPIVKGVSQGYVAGTRAFTNTFEQVGDDKEQSFVLGIKAISSDFKDVYGLEMARGRNFDKGILSDTDQKNVLINQTAAEALGWELGESIGKQLTYLAGGNTQKDTVTVVGVMKDANFESLYNPVMPSVFRFIDNGDISIKLEGTNLLALNESIKSIGATWDEVVPNLPFEYKFLEQEIDKQYVKEERLGKAIQYFGLLAVFIACLGLFGLIAFSTQQRTREIGVRKVLGASARSILTLLTRNFLIMVGISLLISVPVGYYLADLWLRDFTFSVGISPLIFVLAGLLSVLIALLSIGGQSMRAANMNPVKTLRHE